MEPVWHGSDAHPSGTDCWCVCPCPLGAPGWRPTARESCGQRCRSGCCSAGGPVFPHSVLFLRCWEERPHWRGGRAPERGLPPVPGSCPRLTWCWWLLALGVLWHPCPRTSSGDSCQAASLSQRPWCCRGWGRGLGYPCLGDPFPWTLSPAPRTALSPVLLTGLEGSAGTDEFAAAL